MDAQPHLGPKEFYTLIVADMARAVCERPGEGKAQQMLRAQVATQMIMGLLPRDVIEAILAGQSVMLHAVLTDSVHQTLKGEPETMRRGTRANIVAMNKALHMNVDKLKRYQERPAEGTREGSEEARVKAADVQAGGRKEAGEGATANADRASAPVEASPRTAAAEMAAEAEGWPSAPVKAATEVPFRPTKEQITACMLNPEAMAAMDAGDALRFARAMGLANPSEAYLAAAVGLPSDIAGKCPETPPKPADVKQPGDGSSGNGRTERQV